MLQETGGNWVWIKSLFSPSSCNPVPDQLIFWKQTCRAKAVTCSLPLKRLTSTIEKALCLFVIYAIYILACCHTPHHIQASRTPQISQAHLSTFTDDRFSCVCSSLSQFFINSILHKLIYNLPMLSPFPTPSSGSSVISCATSTFTFYILCKGRTGTFM